MKEPSYRVLDIIRGTTVDGPGFRTSIYLAGCTHRCPGCHNPQSWDPSGGTERTLSELLGIIREEEFNVTLSGGDPLMHPESTAQLIRAIREAGYTVWLYTGYTWEEIQASPELYGAVAEAEAVVEGPYVEALRDPSLRFRGSSNQRIIFIR
ncbi:MAG: anaerobic ribonucleoside-triphosphate reductase activating protein [Bacteroidales bacterium]|nr:anaerobic ribonucleoside-triphosphate reductase activating protein [Bacteroidales bacterium]